MSPLHGKKILLGITGGIAAYKSPDLVRRLRDQGAEVRVVMTRSAEKLVAPTVFQAVSGNPVRRDLWDEQAEAAMGHIELARWADLVVIAPATANVMAQLAAGLAGDLLTTLCLVTSAPLVLAPAVTRTCFPASGPVAGCVIVPSAATISAGSAMRPGPVSPQAWAPSAGPTKRVPRAARRLRFAWVAACFHME